MIDRLALETWKSERLLSYPSWLYFREVLHRGDKTVQMSTDNKRTNYQNVYHVQHDTERDSPTKLVTSGRTSYRKAAAATQPGAHCILLELPPPAPPCT
jgi:hypothetical protein